MSNDRVNFIENELANARYNGYAKIAELCKAALAEIAELRLDAAVARKHRRTLEYIASELGFTADEIAPYQPSQMLVGGIASRAAFLLQCTARWEHAKADFLVASEVEAIEARIDAGISARKETT